MASRRFVLIISDAEGRHCGRLTVTTAVLRAAAAASAVLALLVAVMAAHGAYAAVQLRRSTRLAELNGAMARLAVVLEQQQRAVNASVDENNRALMLLSRKSQLGSVPHEPPGAEEEALVDTAAKAPAEVPAPINWTDLGAAEHLVGQTDALLAQGRELEGSLADLLEYWRDAEQRLTYTPSIRPARSPYTTSSYGVRIDPVYHYWVMHKGLDMGGFIGMIVYAPADGIVIWTGVRGGYGQVVVLDHGMGLQTHYAHLSRYLVRPGDVVHRGDPIAEMGSTGKSTGPHLHYEVRQDGVPMDPRKFILD